MFDPKKPTVTEKNSLDLQYLLCIDVYINLQQFYFPLREMFSEDKKEQLKYVFKDSNGLIVGFKVPIKIQKKVLKWTFIYDFLNDYNLLPDTYIKSSIE